MQTTSGDVELMSYFFDVFEEPKLWTEKSKTKMFEAIAGCCAIIWRFVNEKEDFMKELDKIFEIFQMFASDIMEESRLVQFPKPLIINKEFIASGNKKIAPIIDAYILALEKGRQENVVDFPSVSNVSKYKIPAQSAAIYLCSFMGYGRYQIEPENMLLTLNKMFERYHLDISSELVYKYKG